MAAGPANTESVGLNSDLSGLTKEELAQLFGRLSEKEVLLQGKVVAAFRNLCRRRPGESWTSCHKQLGGWGQRTLESRARWWLIYSSLSPDSQMRLELLPDLGDSLGLVAELGRPSKQKSGVAFEEIVSYFEEYHRMPTMTELRARVAGNAAATSAAVQLRLLEVGSALGLHVHLARGDMSKVKKIGSFEGIRLAKRLPPPGPSGDLKTIDLIDVLWLDDEDNYIAAFEVESTTPVYSGLLRMADLSLSWPNLSIPMYIVSPTHKRRLAIVQIDRPAFRRARLNLHERCRLITFDGLFDNSSNLHHVAAMTPESFLKLVSEDCNQAKESIPTDG